MSTSATFQFLNRYSIDLTLKVPRDGNLMGAAEYLHRAVSVDRFNGSLLMRFVRANVSAALAEGHDDTSSAQFQYTLKEREENPTVVARARTGDFRWEVTYEGPLDTFINRYKSEVLPPVILVSGQLTTEALAREAISIRRAMLSSHKARFPSDDAGLLMRGSAIATLETALAHALSHVQDTALAS